MEWDGLLSIVPPQESPGAKLDGDQTRAGCDPAGPGTAIAIHRCGNVWRERIARIRGALQECDATGGAGFGGSSRSSC